MLYLDGANPLSQITQCNRMRKYNILKSNLTFRQGHDKYCNNYSSAKINVYFLKYELIQHFI
jgi:hypothetical protein